jgi:hypothetical protein
MENGSNTRQPSKGEKALPMHGAVCGFILWSRERNMNSILRFS